MFRSCQSIWSRWSLSDESLLLGYSRESLRLDFCLVEDVRQWERALHLFLHMPRGSVRNLEELV